MYDEIVKYVVQSGMTSASLLQRKYRLGYQRAACLIDLLEERGIVGPPNGSKPREVLVKTYSSINNSNINNNSRGYFSQLYGDEILNIDREKSIIDIIDDDMNGYDFEKLTKNILENNGFENVEVTQASGDFGLDVLATKDSIKYAIQCKKYSSKVGVKAVQEVIASKAMNNCHVAVVLTNNYFTDSAIKLAQKNNVLLWNRETLKKLTDNIKK